MVKKALFLFLLFVFGGCATTKLSHYTELEKATARNDYPYAIKRLEAEKEKSYKEKDRLLYYLDMGMLLHYNKEYEKSNKYLSLAENAIDELFTKSISKAASSLLLNDNTLEYAGEDYEDIYVNIFKSLNYIHLEKFDNAFVEINRINHKLSVLENKYKKVADEYNKAEDGKINFKTSKNKFHNDALGRYLSMLLYSLEGKVDDANIDYNYIKKAFAQQIQIYNFSMPKIKYDTPKDKIRLNFISFIGRTPIKKANTLYIHTEKNFAFIATTSGDSYGKTNMTYLDQFFFPGLEKGYHFKFQLPYLVERGSSVKKINLYIDSLLVGKFEMIENNENIAKETFQIKEPLIYIKTITRAITKGILAEKSKEQINKKVSDNTLGSLLGYALDFTMDATESADLRISRFFPAYSYISTAFVYEGNHHIKVEYEGNNGNILYTDDFGKREIRKNGINIFETYYLR